MIRVTIDDDMHEADVELVNDFAQALNDRDPLLLDDLLGASTSREIMSMLPKALYM